MNEEHGQSTRLLNLWHHTRVPDESLRLGAGIFWRLAHKHGGSCPLLNEWPLEMSIRTGGQLLPSIFETDTKSEKPLSITLLLYSVCQHEHKHSPGSRTRKQTFNRAARFGGGGPETLDAYF